MKKLSKIIIAEDEPDLQIITKTVLEELGAYTVKVCGNGQILLDSIEEYAPDLILLDVMMPVMDGLTAYKNLKEIEGIKDVPVVFMTAKAQVHEIQEYAKLGAQGIITKPFDPLKLCEDIEGIWQKFAN